ncbi:SAM-dependent chlorinase/fluorinase [Candidatus Woesearchaeota archaeon]|nr:SAM-dependent chlorinase/fluorinase [Candidatus Woesearchaeota archaeon]
MVIALLTDFDGSDGLGLVKGVIYDNCPHAKIVDLYNDVEPFQVRSGAWILLQDYKYFPKGTIFYAVVDPGVGGKRRCVAVKTKNYYFAGPDNGIIYSAATEDGIEIVVELQVPATASKTFQGRDVFAPAAAKLEKGIAIEKLGKKTDKNSMRQLRFASGNGEGEIVVVEHYGNIVTTIKPFLQQLKKPYKVECGNFKNNLNYHETYEEAKDGELFVITGSRNTLELAVRNGSAAAVVNAKVGDNVAIK